MLDIFLYALTVFGVAVLGGLGYALWYVIIYWISELKLMAKQNDNRRNL